MKLTIDTDKIDKSNLTIGETLCLTSLYLKNIINVDTIRSLKAKGLIRYDCIINNNIKGLRINNNGTNALAILVLNSEVQQTVNTENGIKDRFEVLADKLREIYPKGKKEGTAYQWRDSTSIITLKLKALVKKFNANFTDEQAINATRKYVESFHGDYRFMQILKYFISKRKVGIDGSVEDSSQLLSYIENEGQEDISSTDWTSELK